MSLTLTSPGVVAPLDTPGGTDRRSDCRYPIVLRLQCKLIRNDGLSGPDRCND
jgi:hypothetical protein